MIYVVTNLRAILSATAGGLLVGVLYRLTGGAGPAGADPGLVLASVLAEFWLASILAGALILAPPRAGPWTMALGSAVVIWAGFVAPTVLVTGLWHGGAVATGLADCAQWLVAMLVQGAILHAVGLTPPPD